MSFHYLDESHRYRDCHCISELRMSHLSVRGPCHTCNDTGKLGDPDCKPELYVSLQNVHGIRSWILYGDEGIVATGESNTQDEAIAAARYALSHVTE